MILNRIANRLRKGDWRTVIVEILIVVVGIFLGLQVDDWNELRKERHRETRYLERLYEDLENDIQTIGSSLDWYSARQNMGDFLLETIKNPELVRSDPSRFVTSIQLAAFTTPPAISDHTFEELKFSGDLVIIQDESLRSDLSKYYTEIERFGQYTFSRETQKINYGNARLGILTADQIRSIMKLGPRASETLEFSEDEAWQAYQRMIQKPAFIDEIPRGTNHGHEIRTYTIWMQKAKDLRAEIGENLGRDRKIP